MSAYVRFCAIAMLLGPLAMPLSAQSSPGNDLPAKQAATMHPATGSFTVKLVPQKDEPSDPKLARMTIDKQFIGALEATSIGQMLSAGTDTKGSAGYVAIEKVTGKLEGRSGSLCCSTTR
jgi:hypothetical protein